MTLPQLDYAAWKFWLSVLQLVGIVLLGVYSWWTNREKVNKKRLGQLKADIDLRLDAVAKDVKTKVGRTEAEKLIEDHGGQCRMHRRRTDDLADQTKHLELTVRGLQSEVGHLPTANEIQHLNDNLRSVTEKLGKLDGRIEGIGRAADLMNEFLISQGGNK